MFDIYVCMYIYICIIYIYIYMYNICTCKTNYMHTPQNKDHFDVGFGFTTGWNGVMEWGTLFSNLILVAV